MRMLTVSHTGILLMAVLVISITVGSGAMHTADATRTAGFYFCNVFTTHPECTGWRNIPIMDNFWFCEYVDLPSMCKYKPDPQKQILSQFDD